MPTPNTPMPIEIELDHIKTSIAQYVNGLAAAHQIPSTFMLYILQELVDESKLRVYEQTIQKLQSQNIDAEEIDIDLTDEE